MKSSFLIVLTFSCYLILALTLLDFGSTEKTQADALKPDRLVVHEWGTFTSIAGKNGIAIDWRPLAEASDLPAFVYTESESDGFRGTYKDGGKGSLARVRMETPVIYFYTPRETEVSVQVGFPQGRITEWYPQASVVNATYEPGKKGRFEAGINWGTIKLLPGEKPEYLREVSRSHYYPARETDSVPVQVCNADRSRIEREKFLFYRGVGDFELPLKVALFGEEKNQIQLGNLSRETIKNLIVFENRGGRVGFRKVSELTPSVGQSVGRPVLNQKLFEVLDELKQILIAEGLYEKEASAMIATWQDSWFEEGLRVFYILPTKMTDRVLPLKIEPRPAETVRVLVGRTEVITPEMERDVKRQISLLKSASAETREKAESDLKKYGRFYEPVLKMILENERDPQAREQIRKLIDLS
jgi:hypothetical protein